MADLVALGAGVLGRVTHPVVRRLLRAALLLLTAAVVIVVPLLATGAPARPVRRGRAG